MGFGLVIGFIEHLQIVSKVTSTITNSHTLQFTTAHTKVFTGCRLLMGFPHHCFLSFRVHVLTGWFNRPYSSDTLGALFITNLLSVEPLICRSFVGRAFDSVPGHSRASLGEVRGSLLMNTHTVQKHKFTMIFYCYCY
jgi:hypothetical protein